MSTVTHQMETGFEKKRGISHVEIRDGMAQVHVRSLESPLMERRLSILRTVASAGISLDFLKLTSDGLSFLVPQGRAAAIAECLTSAGVQFEIGDGRSIVMVHAVNMRDEEGLLAKIVAAAIGTGVLIDHLGDMHDRLLIVVESNQAAGLATALQERLAS